MIEEDGAAISEAAATSVTQSLWTLGIAVLVATITLVLGALWVAHLMAIPMGHAVAAAGHLALQLVQAVAVFKTNREPRLGMSLAS